MHSPSTAYIMYMYKMHLVPSATLVSEVCQTQHLPLFDKRYVTAYREVTSELMQQDQTMIDSGLYI